jgi:hypothetical protein
MTVITVSLVDHAGILVIMYNETFKTDVIVLMAMS